MTLAAGIRVTVGGRTLTSAEAALAAVWVELSTCGAHDAAELVLWRGSRLEGIAPDDEVGIALGEAGSEIDVWTGRVQEIESGPDGLVVTGLSLTDKLSHVFRSQAYLQQGVADIVNDLAADVPIDTVDCDLRLESYCVDTRLSVWEHLLELAAVSGCAVGASPAGGLRFTPASAPGDTHELRYGADLVAWRVASRAARVPAAVAAHGAASEQGSGRWHWPLNDPAPSATDDRTEVIGAFHSKDAADALSEAYAAAARRGATVGHVEAWNRPELRPGDQLELAGLPGGDRTVRVLAVTHRVDGRRGFVTECRVEGGQGGGGPLGALSP